MNELLLAFGRGDPRIVSGALVVCSMGLAIVGANLAWSRRLTQGDWVIPLLGPIGGSGSWRGLYEICRLVYYVGVPYAALYLGWVDLRAMGLGFLDWAKGLRWAIVLGLATWSLLMFVWVPYLRATLKMTMQGGAQDLTWSRRVVEVVFMQAHWAFYRAACIVLLRSVLQDDLAMYWGSSVGLGLVFLEAWADPRVRRRIAQVGEAEPPLWNAGQAVINAVGFVLTRNVWLLAVLHLVLEFTVPHLRVRSRPPVPAGVPGRVEAPDARL
jgi:hypothetical protein